MMKNEIKLLNLWKALYNEPKHTVIINDTTFIAYTGVLPDANMPKDYNDRIHSETVNGLGYIGNFPLIIRKISGADVTNITVNERFKERHLYTDFICLQKGLISNDYLKSYTNSENDEVIKVDNLAENLIKVFKEREEVMNTETTSNGINNFEQIEQFMKFEEGTFYKFELLVRNTDGENILFPERSSNTNRNILIKSWYVDTKNYYEKIKHEMITLSNLTGARLYVTLDRKENVKLVQSLIHSFTDTLCAICRGQKPSIKNISKIFASETSKVENSCKETKTLMWDVDTKNAYVLNALKAYITSKGQVPMVLETKKGYHVVCYRKFNHQDWLNECKENLILKITQLIDEKPISDVEQLVQYKQQLTSYVSVKENELGLVYHPMKSCE